jgi:type I restriction enzyme S subunit
MAKNPYIPYAPWLDLLPSDWKADRLKDIVPRIVGGGTPSSSDLDFWEDGDIVWLTPTDFSKDAGGVEIFDSERKITRAGLNASAAVLLSKGTVIMASRATIGAVRIAGTELTTNQGFISFICDEVKLHHRFLYYVIVGFLGGYFAEIAPGTTFNEISRGEAKQEPIGFPLLSEQKRITAYLDACCVAIDAVASHSKQADDPSRLNGALNRQIGILTAYRKSLIHECVTGQRRVAEADLIRVQKHV